MSLRSFLSTLAVALALIALVSAGVVVRLTTLLHTTAKDLQQTVSAVRSVETARADLLMLDDLFARVGDTPQRAEALAHYRSAIERSLADARSLADSPHEHEMLDEIDARIREYLRIERQVEALPAEERAARSRPAFFSARESLKAYAAFREQRAIELGHEAARLDRLGDFWGYGNAAFAILAALVVAVLAWRWLALPLVGLREGTARYARGEPPRAIVERGPAELKATIRTFNEMVATLEQQRAGQLTFLAGVVHDLRNPLTALRASMATFSPERPLPPEPRIRKTIALVDRQLSRLDRMTGDLLETSRAMSGNLVLKLEERDLRELVSDAVALFRPMSDVHELVTELPPTAARAVCDPVRIEQVLANLLGNAIKYSPEGGRVVVSLRPIEDAFELAVADAGVGIAPEELARIFEPFKRVARSEAIPGTGLGLAVVKRIVEAHGGTITVDSTPGRGSTFVVRLPSAKAHARKPKLEPASPPPAHA